MAITVQYQPHAGLLGQAANQAGYGIYQQNQQKFNEQVRQFDTSLEEQQRQFDGSQEFRYDSLGEQARQFDGSQDFRRDAMGLQANQFNAQMMGREQDKQFQAFQNAIDRQLKIDSQKFQVNAQARAQEVQLRGQMESQERAYQNQMGMQVQNQRNQQLARTMESDWNAIQKQWGGLDEAQREEITQRFQDHYSASGIQMPMEMPSDMQAKDPNEDYASDYKSTYGVSPPRKPDGTYDMRAGAAMAPWTPGGRAMQRADEEQNHKWKMEENEILSGARERKEAWAQQQTQQKAEAQAIKDRQAAEAAAAKAVRERQKEQIEIWKDQKAFAEEAAEAAMTPSTIANVKPVHNANSRALLEEADGYRQKIMGMYEEMGKPPAQPAPAGPSGSATPQSANQSAEPPKLAPPDAFTLKEMDPYVNYTEGGYGYNGTQRFSNEEKNDLIEQVTFSAQFEPIKTDASDMRKFELESGKQVTVDMAAIERRRSGPRPSPADAYEDANDSRAGTLPTPEDEVKRLPSGASFTGPDGRTYVKR